MKPFIRFSGQLNPIGNDPEKRSLYWDFDHFLRVLLLKIMRSIATSEEIYRASIEQWKTNLNRLYQRRLREFDEAVATGISPRFETRHRDSYVLKNTRQGSRFLYLGCGSGTECITLAREGYDVVGIDTDPKLVSISNKWAEHLGLPFKAICMDALKLDLEPRSFDGLLLEFYGQQPSSNHVTMLHQNLKKVLKDDGRGHIVACRREYDSHMYMMFAPHIPAEMLRWLVGQPYLDFRFAGDNGGEEALSFGLYSKPYSVESLRSELGANFDILKCECEQFDPRYIICTVKPKHPMNAAASSPNFEKNTATATENRPDLIATFEELLNHVEAVCAVLEKHEKELIGFFAGRSTRHNQNPLATVGTDLNGFIDMLDTVFDSARFMVEAWEH